MTKVSEIKLFEAEALLEDAAARLMVDTEISPSLAIVYSTEALILSVDAMCHHLGVLQAKRHDESHQIFRTLLTQGKIPADGSKFREFLKVANAQRAAYHCHGELTSRANARRFVREAAQFVAFARSVINR